MEFAVSVVKDGSVLRMIFATAYLPEELPNYWDIIASFSCIGCKSNITSDKVKLLMENLQIINKETLGVALISEKQVYRKCGGRLLLRRDHPTRVTLYTEVLDLYQPIITISFAKIKARSAKQTHTQVAMVTIKFLSVCMYVCVYRGCNVTQFYGYSKEGEKQGIIYDTDWKAHTYFLSSQETGFEMSMLRKFDVELLIGNISFIQAES